MVNGKNKYLPAVILTVIFLDQLSKYLVVTSGIAHSCNRGFAFGLLPGVLNLLISAVVLLIFSYLTLRAKGLSGLAAALVVAGGFSNLIDRLARGCVIDFIQWPSQTWIPLPAWIVSSLTRWPAFNLADSAVVVGVGLLVFLLIRNRG